MPSGPTITISGGTVTATGGDEAAGIGVGSSGGDAGTFTLNGNAVVFASSISDTQASRKRSGILFIGNTGTFYGTSVTLGRNATIPSGRTLTIPSNATLTIPAGITLTNNGTITPANGSTVTVAGTVNGSNKIIGANTAPKLSSKTTTSITLNEASLLAATGQTVEYAKNTTNSVPTSGWQTDATFTDLTDRTTYWIFARSISNTYFATGTASAGLQVATKGIPAKEDFNIPTGHIYGNASGLNINIAGMGKATVYYDGSTTKPTNAGTYSVTVDVEEGTEFVAASGIELGKYEINPRSVTIAGLSASSKEYDGNTTAAFTGTATVSGKIINDDVTVSLGTASFYTKNVGTSKTVIFSGFSLGGADANNYRLSAQPSGTANITAKPLTITGISASDKEYDGNATATAVTGAAKISGAISGDKVTVTEGSATFNNKNVGTAKTVTFAGFKFGGTDASNYSLAAQPASVVANITAKPVTITGLSVTNKEYDRNVAATITGTTTISGKIGSDNVSVVNGTASFANRNAGTSKTVTFSGFSISGTAASNYTLTEQPAAVTANITPKPITVSGITIHDKEYDGNTTATVTGTATFSGKINGDDLTVIPGTISFEDKNAGTNKTADLSTCHLIGADADNYIIEAHPKGVTANITPKPITVTGIAAIDRDYNGTTKVELTGGIFNGVLSNDNVFAGTGTVATPDIGNNKTVTNITLAGKDAGNYTFTQPTGITANITSKNLTITGVTATNRAYNGTTTVELTGGTLNGVANNSVVGFKLGIGTVATPDVGSNKAVTTNITLTGADAGNYTLTQPTGITVTIIDLETPIFPNRENPKSGKSGFRQ